MATRIQFKRAAYEWGAIAALNIAVYGFGFWAVSLCTAALDVSMTFGIATDAHVTEGAITVSRGLKLNDLGTWQEDDDLRGWACPGFRYNYITFATGEPCWIARCSALLPATFSALLAVLCVRQYRRERRKPPQVPIEELAITQASPGWPEESYISK
jgi:hypothetical protein